MKYDDASLAQEHLTKLDPLNPNVVTHFCSVPLADVPLLMQLPETKESDVFWKLEDMTCDQLSKLLTQYYIIKMRIYYISAILSGWRTLDVGRSTLQRRVSRAIESGTADTFDIFE